MMMMIIICIAVVVTIDTKHSLRITGLKTEGQ